MPQANQLEMLLKRAKMVCTNKHDQVASSLNGTPSTRFIDLDNEQKSLFLLLMKPTSFNTEMPSIDKTELETQITALDVLDPSQFTEYLTLMESFLFYLKEKVLNQLLANEADNPTSDWNLKVLDALRGMRRKITGRKRFFKNKGKDIADDPIYKQHKIIRNDYREKLKNNTVQSVATDEMVLQKFKKDIAKLTLITTFMDMIGKTNAFMEEKSKVETEPPPIV